MQKIGVVGLLTCLLASPVSAERTDEIYPSVELERFRGPLPAVQLSADARVTLARALVGEADWNTPDHIAIAWVLAKRWKFAEHARPGSASFSQVIRSYAAPLKTKSDRTAWVQTLPWDAPLTGALVPYTKHWDKVKRVVTAWSSGRIKDPCPRAVHWGGTMDQPAKRWRPVDCGLTRNIFYSVPDNVYPLHAIEPQG